MTASVAVARHTVVRPKRLGSPENAARARNAERVVAACGLALVCCALATGRGAALEKAPTARAVPEPHPSISSGLPWDGRLKRAVRLKVSPILHPIAKCAPRGNFYGTSELVSLLERSAQAIAGRWPGSELSVGELSAANGGKLDGHHSHRSGRDADVAFFMRDEQGRAASFWRFVAFSIEGTALHVQRVLHFDDARNWALVSTMLRDQEARVQYMFVAQPLRTRLLMEGRRQAESEDFLRAAAAVLVEPKEGQKHDSHFHVRIYCARDDRPECRDSAPYWPWYDGSPPDGQRAELPTIDWRMPSMPAPQSAPQVQRASTDPRSI
ncbi:MAG: penicillin-insensitive murein endopeptidase [Polyangiales bacterium]